MTPVQALGGGVFRLDLGKANVYVLLGSDGLTLMDTATAGSLPALERAFQTAGWSLSDVRRIVVTHAHVDHAGGLSELRAATRAAVWAHPLDAPHVRAGTHPPYPDSTRLRWNDRLLGSMVDRGVGRRQPAAPVDREVGDGELLGAALPGWRAIHLPGHTPGQLGLWWPERRLLLGGDVLMHLTPWLTLPLAAYTTDAAEARDSVRRVADLRPDVLGLGHGSALVGGAQRAVERLLARLRR